MQLCQMFRSYPMLFPRLQKNSHQALGVYLRSVTRAGICKVKEELLPICNSFENILLFISPGSNMIKSSRIFDQQRPGQVLAPLITVFLYKSPNLICNLICNYFKYVGLPPLLLIIKLVNLIFRNLCKIFQNPIFPH